MNYNSLYNALKSIPMPMTEKGRKNLAKRIINNMDSRRGGARKGAGRKPRETPLGAITVKIEPELVERFREVCKARGRSQAKQISEWIKRARI